MTFRRTVSGVLFVVGVYVFGMYLTAVDAGPALTNHLLFALFGANDRAGVDCTEGEPELPCSPKILKAPNGAVEIVDLGTDPPTRKKSIDLGASNPTSIAVAPDGKRFYFVDALNRNVYFVDSATGAFMNTTFIPEGPLDCVLTSNGKYLYVTTEEPSVVVVETTFGTIVDEAAPGQPYAERFGGLALNPGAGTKQLAVAATSSAPAFYLFSADQANVGVGPRFEVSGYCTDPFCGASDDITYLSASGVLLANLVCSEVYRFAVPSGQQISGGPFSSQACMPLNPQNSLLYSPLSQLAYLVYRRFSLGIAPGMAIVDPADFSSSLLPGYQRIPEAAAFAPDGRALYIIGQNSFDTPLLLDHYDALTGTLSGPIYTFSPMMNYRTAIDARIVQATGVFSLLAGGLPVIGARSSAAALGQAALLIFAGALLWIGRHRAHLR